MSAISNTLTRFLAEEHHDDSHDDSNVGVWGDVILGTFLVQLVAFSGLVFTVSMNLAGRSPKKTSILYRILVPSFAMGAIFATAVFLLIPESIHAFILGAAAHEVEEHGDDHAGGEHDPHDHFRRRFLEEEGEEHHEDELDESFAWKFGICFALGFLIPAAISFAFPKFHAHHTVLPAEEDAAEQPKQEDNKTQDCCDVEDSNDDPIKDNKQEDVQTEQDGCTTDDCNCPPIDGAAPVKRNWALASTILIGDACCNFTDGVFIGTAFKLCDSSVGYTIVATTVYHELAQEIGDYVLLTQQCGFTPLMALLANLGAGLAVLLGAIIVVLADMSDTAVGSILSIAAGVYIYLCGTEILPRIQQGSEDQDNRMTAFVGFLLSFVIGAVPVGLVLLNHGHCDAGH